MLKKTMDNNIIQFLAENKEVINAAFYITLTGAMFPTAHKEAKKYLKPDSITAFEAGRETAKVIYKIKKSIGINNKGKNKRKKNNKKIG